jgi:hypothetical protein
LDHVKTNLSGIVILKLHLDTVQLPLEPLLGPAYIILILTHTVSGDLHHYRTSFSSTSAASSQPH